MLEKVGGWGVMERNGVKRQDGGWRGMVEGGVGGWEVMERNGEE